MFKVYHFLVPEIFQSFFTLNNTIHNYDTKQANLLHVFGADTSQGERTLRVVATSIYNYFHGILELTCKYNTYKYHLKKCLIDNDVSLSDILPEN